MSFSKSQAFYIKSKKSDTRIPRESLRLKGQRGYNQRNTASLMLTPLTKKKLVASGLFNRVLKNASNQRKKLKGFKKKLSFSYFARKQAESEAKSMSSITESKSMSPTTEATNMSSTTKVKSMSSSPEAIRMICITEAKNLSTTSEATSMSSTHEAKKISTKLEQCDPYITMETFEHNETCTQDKLSNDYIVGKEILNVEHVKSSQRLMTEDKDASYTSINEIKETIEFIKSSEKVQKRDDENGKRSILSKQIEENYIQDFNKMVILNDQRNFKVSPVIVNVYNLTEVEHPDTIEGIFWSSFREEKYRLLSFVRYPLTAVQSAVLLAEDGFVYTGKGEAMDDTVTCYFCCVQKNRWKANDVISDIHREISPNCSMITKINCDNIPLRTSRHDSQNFDELLNKLNSKCYNELSRQPIQDNVNKGHETHGNVNQRSRDIDTDSEIVSIQNDSTLSRPKTSRGNTTLNKDLNTEDMRPMTLMTSMSTLDNLSTTQEPTSTSGRRQTDPSNITVQATTSSGSTIQSFANVPSSPQITLPHNSTAPRNTEANSVTNIWNAGHTSMGSAEQPSVAKASSVQLSSNSATVSQTTSNYGEKKSGKGPSYADLGIITERPKRPEYAVKETRKKTFDRWPPSHHLTPEDLSDAGFYFAGYGDCARCFYCGGGLRNWEDEDDVWVEHARWFPKCAYIRQQMGQVFVDTVQELNTTLDVITFAMVKERCKVSGKASSLDTKLDPLKRDPAVLTVVDIGYSLTDVLQVAKIIKGKDAILSSDVLLTKLRELKKQRVTKTSLDPRLVTSSTTFSQDEEAIRQLKERNNQLRQQTVCKICMDKEVAVVFLPCGHLVSCAECASAMKDCPVCRVTVKGVVRAFL